MFVWDAFFPLHSAWPFTIMYILYNLQHVSSIFNGVVLSHVCSIVVWKTSWSGGLGHPSVLHWTWPSFFMFQEWSNETFNWFPENQTSYTSTTYEATSFVMCFFMKKKSLLSHCWPLFCLSWRKSWTLNVRPGVGWRWTTVSGCAWFLLKLPSSPSWQHRETDRIHVV